MTPIQQAIAILEEDALTNRIERALEVLRGVPQSSRDRIYEVVLRELETQHPIPTTVLLATRIANALSDTRPDRNPE